MGFSKDTVSGWPGKPVSVAAHKIIDHRADQQEPAVKNPANRPFPAGRIGEQHNEVDVHGFHWKCWFGFVDVWPEENPYIVLVRRFNHCQSHELLPFYVLIRTQTEK